MDLFGGDLFDGEAIADGYDSARPALHGPIMERVAGVLDWSTAMGGRTVVDVGCGAGASTAAVRPWSDSVTGLDPAVAMVTRAARRHRDARFCVGSGLALPIRSGAVDALVAAGALNFMDLATFRAEASRVLVPDGVVIVYDFSTGRRTVGDATLTAAYDEFAQRWPRPVANRHPVDSAVLGAAGFALRTDATFVETVTMTGADYLRYLMTETNVVGGIATGHDRHDIERWCRERFAPSFASSSATPIPIEFDCWYAVVDPRGSADHVRQQ